MTPEIIKAANKLLHSQSKQSERMYNNYYNAENSSEREYYKRISDRVEAVLDGIIKAYESIGLTIVFDEENKTYRVKED